jgi:hypothetical protein
MPLAPVLSCPALLQMLILCSTYSHACDAVKGFLVDKKRTFDREFDNGPSPQRHRNHVRLNCRLVVVIEL